MQNVINVKEERNVLSFSGEVFNLVANSTNFYLKFELEKEWAENSIITVIFNFDGKNEYVELDENLMCQIPPTNSSRVWFCITTEPDEVSKLSSTILSLDVEATGDTDTSNVEVYQNAHKNLLGVVQNLLSGNGIKAEYAKVAEMSTSQVSLTGDQEISGVKNFKERILNDSKIIPNCGEVSNKNMILNSNFAINERKSSTYTREGEDIYTADRWCLMGGNGTFDAKNKVLTGADETASTILAQWFEFPETEQIGKTLTFSADINGERRSATITIPESVEEDTAFNLYVGEDCTARFYWYESKTYFGLQFVVENGKSVTLDRVKVEESEFETRYITPSQAEEILQCKRFFQKTYLNGAGYAVTEEKVGYFLPLSTRIRSYKKIIVSNMPQAIVNGEIVDVFTEAKATRIYDNGFYLSLIGTGFTKNEIYYLTSGQINFDSEIYV